ncbi:tol-pal system protein YbgF [bacterium]|nr:MAG: tol-pal system protein YbgF [bacterium]
MLKISYKILLFIALLAMSQLFQGCATRGEIKRFQQQVEYLTEANAEQQRQLSRIDSMLTAQQEFLHQLSANQQYNMEQLQAEMQIIENIFKESGYKVSELTQKIENIRQEMATAQPQTQDSTDTVSSEPEVTINPKQLFETASLDYNKGKFELSKMEFEQFLSLFPRSALADDAQYSIAECLFALGKYNEAKAQYLELQKKFPSSPLVPDALFKAASSSLKMDDIKSARILLKEIVEKYPQSDVAPRAEEKLKKIEE